MYRPDPAQMNVQFTARASAIPLPFCHVVLYLPQEFLPASTSGITRPIPPRLVILYHPLSRVPRTRRRREVCDSPLPRGANYIVRNVNLVCQAVSAREGSLTSLDGTCTSLAITVPRDEEISSYSWEHPTARSIRSIHQYQEHTRIKGRRREGRPEIPGSTVQIVRVRYDVNSRNSLL